MKKLLTIALATTFVLGCGSAPSQEKESVTNSGGDSINLPDNGESYTNPCDVPSYQKLLINGKIVVVEIPTLCNVSFSPDHGDPCPDCGDPDPGKEQINPDPGDKQITPQVFKGRSERQGSAR